MTAPPVALGIATGPLPALKGQQYMGTMTQRPTNRALTNLLMKAREFMVSPEIPRKPLNVSTIVITALISALIGGLGGTWRASYEVGRAEAIIQGRFDLIGAQFQAHTRTLEDMSSLYTERAQFVDRRLLELERRQLGDDDRAREFVAGLAVLRTQVEGMNETLREIRGLLAATRRDLPNDRTGGPR